MSLYMFQAGLVLVIGRINILQGCW